jgi:hypothetical protein
VQGDHNVCRVDFRLDDGLRELLGGEPVAVIEAIDGHGAFYVSERLTVTDSTEQMSYIFSIPQELTAAGGTVQAWLVLCNPTGDSTVSYSYPMTWRFKSSSHGSNGYGVVKKSLVGLAAEAAQSAERAALSERAANETAAAIQEQVEGAVAATEASAQAAAESAAAAKEASVKDWAENDESSPTFIQNRTHYEYCEPVELSVTFNATADEHGVYAPMALTDEQKAWLNEQFAKCEKKVIFNREFNVDITVFEGIKVLADGRTWQVGVFEADYSIFIYNTTYGVMSIGTYADGVAVATELNAMDQLTLGDEVVFIGQGNATVKPLDEKFLPDSVARQEDLAQLDTRIADLEQALDGVETLLGGI